MTYNVFGGVLNLTQLNWIKTTESEQWCVRCVKACRGNEFDEGKEFSDSGKEATDAISEPAPAQRIPIEADFIYAYSTVPGLCHCLRAMLIRIITVSIISINIHYSASSRFSFLTVLYPVITLKANHSSFAALSFCFQPSESMLPRLLK